MKAVGKFFALLSRLRFYEVLLLVFIAILLGAWSVKEITESALFCGSSCHIMRPYYEDWKTSAHNTVPCVDCHLEPSTSSSSYRSSRPSHRWPATLHEHTVNTGGRR